MPYTYRTLQGRIHSFAETECYLGVVMNSVSKASPGGQFECELYTTLVCCVSRQHCVTWDAKRNIANIPSHMVVPRKAIFLIPLVT